MRLRGQGEPAGRGGNAAGYAMAALLVGMSVMAVLMGAALPVWNKQAQREREEEYLFRATEYARAIQKFQRRAGPGTLPPTFDVLVEGRFLRRKYKDPFTGGDFQPVYQTSAPIGQSGGAARPGGLVGTTPTTPTGGTPTTQSGGTPTSGTGAPVPGAGIIGVVSKSKASSIKIYNGRTRYDQWAVTYQDVKPGKGLPPDLLLAINATKAGAAGAGGAGGASLFGQPGAQPTGSPFGQPGASPFGQPQGGASPFGQPAGPPGANPFAQPGAPPGASPFGTPGGTGGFSPAYPPPPGTTVAPPILGAPPRKMP